MSPHTRKPSFGGWGSRLTVSHAVKGLAASLFAIALLALAPTISAADTTICSSGTGAGECGASGLALDEETGRLYVADNANHRIDVFSSSGSFEMAFGWGVKDGASKLEVCTTSCREGLAGSGAGQLDHPASIAIDNIPGSSSRHDIYVVDLASSRVEKFDPEGHFLLAFGEPGEGEGQFSSARSRGILVGVGPGGTVYVADTLGEFDMSGNLVFSKARLQRFSEAGALLEPGKVLFEGPKEDGKPEALAVSPTGSFYVSTEGAVRSEPGTRATVRRYTEAGSLEGVVAEERDRALSADSAGHLFSAGNTEVALPGPLAGSTKREEVAESSESGSLIRKFAYGAFLVPGQPSGVAASSSTSEAYVIDEGRVALAPFPGPGPVIMPEKCLAEDVGSGAATLVAEVNPEGQETKYHYEMVTDAQFQRDVAEFGAGHGFDDALRVPANAANDPSMAARFVLQLATAQAELAPETKYHCRVVAENAAGGATGQEGEFESREPFEFGAFFVTSVSPGSAVLHAEGNPLGIEASGFFEYVDNATYERDVAELGPGHGFDHAREAPDVESGEEPLPFGAGDSSVAREVAIDGLAPGTAYRFRLKVESPRFPTGSITCPRAAGTCPGFEPVFRTPAVLSAGLPDGRSWELVSPDEKGSGEVAVPGGAGGLFERNELVPRIEAASDSGGNPAVTYTSWTSFGEAPGAPGTSQYLSKRTEQGWETENISPAGRQFQPLNPVFRGFSPNLQFAALVNLEPPLTAEAQPGVENMYLRDNDSGVLNALTKEPITFTPGRFATALTNFCTTYAGVTADGSRAFFSADGAMGSALSGEGISLYEWSATGPLGLISVLPDGTAAPPADRTHFGGEAEICLTDQGAIRNAVSSNGSVVFWTYGGTYKESPEPLLARIGGTETVQLDAKAPGEKSGGKGRFWAATADGSRAFFTAPGRLTANAHAPGQLYSYNTETHSTSDLTPGSIAPEIEGVIGVSQDGNAAYFVGMGALTGGQENTAGETAEPGKENLYSWSEGEGLRFIAILAGQDGSDWGALSVSTARLTPDGRHLAFLSTETKALSGYDNTRAGGEGCQPGAEYAMLEGDPHCSEAYLYDAETHALDCVSCNPTGARPAGPATVPGWTNAFEGPRYLSDDGNRLFFESRDSLTTTDKDEKRDIYEFERTGTGTCTSGSNAFIQTTDGCLSLISNGKSEDDSFFIDASASGRDVYFATRSQLVGWDQNEDFDVYDAREGGGFPEPPPSPQPCASESFCKPPSPSPPPLSGAPASVTFSGAGNLAPSLPSRPKPKAKLLTRAQKLAKALKACRKDKPRSKRRMCEKHARKTYGAKPRPKAKAKRKKRGK